MHNTSPYHGTPRVKVLQYMYICLIFFSESLLYEFLIFLPVAKGLVFVSLPLPHECSKWTEEWELHFPKKCLARKWHLKWGKMNQALPLAPFFTMQKPIGCGITTKKCYLLMNSLPPPRDTHTHRHENDHFNLLTFFGVIISSQAW